MTAVIAAFASCAESEEMSGGTSPQGKVAKICVSPYPAFAEGAGTRSSVGTFDAGKTEWEAGDELQLVIGNLVGTADKMQCVTLTYDGSEWNANQPLFQVSKKTEFNVTYAPGMTFSEESSSYFVFKDGVQPGTTERINGSVAMKNDSLVISFSSSVRGYSRLRIAGEPSSEVNVSLTDFMPAGTIATESCSYALQTDEKGNAYLYGTWEAGTDLNVTGAFDVNGKNREIALFRKTLESASEFNKGYVADARLSYKSEGAGTETDPYKILLPQQLADLAEKVNSGALAETERHFALQEELDLSSYPDWTPIGNIAHPFTGVFDGQGHTISGLTINNNNPNNAKEWGLFGMVKDATIQFIRVDGSITLTNFGDEDDGGYGNKDGVGGIAGRCSGTAKFEGCHNDVDISGTGNGYFASIGGIVGFQIDGNVTLIACANTGKLQALGEGNTSQIPTAGFIGTAYKKSNTTTITAEANYCNAEIRTNYIPYVFYGELNGSGIIKYAVDSNYWMKVNGSPSSAWINSELTEGFTEVNGSDVTWQTAKDAMNECLSAKYPGFGYEYVENTGADALAAPLVLKPVAQE